MNKRGWCTFSALCFIGFWILAACRLASSQTVPEPTLLTSPVLTIEPNRTPAGEPANTQADQTSTELTLTQVDHGTTIDLLAGQHFALQLGDAAQWEVTIADPNIVSRLTGITTEQGVQGIYEAKNLGQTTLTATASGDREAFQVTIVVAAAGALSTTLEPGTNQPLFFNTVHMVTPLEGWAVGSSQAGAEGEAPQPQDVFRTMDGGHTWRKVTPPGMSRTQSLIVATYFTDLLRGWLASTDRTEADGNPDTIIVYGTEDGGQTWHVSPSLGGTAGEASGGGLQGSLTFVNDQNGWLLVRLEHAGSESANLYHTQNGGQTWTMVATSGGDAGSLPRGCSTTGMTFRDPQTGWITGSCAGRQIYFYVTQDGGQTWVPDNLQPPTSYPAGLFSGCRCTVLPPHFPVGQSGVLPVSILDNNPAAFLYLSQDSGESWLPYSVPMITLTLPPAFADSQNGWISDGKALYVTQDGGQSWTWISKLPTQYVLGEMNFVTPQNGFITDGQMFYASQDGGVTWTSWQPASE